MDNDEETDEEYRKRLAQRTRDSIVFFSNQQKAERERSVVRAFLRFLGVAFKEKDLKVSQPEPVDVAVFEARFQITDVLGPGRKRHVEFKKRLIELETISNGNPCEVDWRNPVPMGWAEIVRLIGEVLPKKTAYSDIDLLVHIALGQRFLNLKSAPADLANIICSRWRSVSVAFPPFAIVLHASELAPGFLKAKVGASCRKWESPEGWYEKAPTVF
jgi:hypothetical protein